MSALVSTIIPVYNRPAMLREAVASVLSQTYRPIEVIVVDDGSTDSTPEVIRNLASEHPEVKTVRRENGGPGAARESGRHIARGNYIQYLDSDDRLLPRRFEVLVAALEKNPDCGIAYGLTRYIDGSGREIACDWKKSNQLQKTLFPSILLSRWWDTTAPLYRASVCDAVGPWTDLRLEEDWEYDFRVAALGIKLCHVPEYLVEVRMHEEERLGRGAALDQDRLRHRARAHALMFGHAIRTGIPIRSPEMQHFVRELFLLARQCGAAGLPAESRELFELAESASADHPKRWQLRVYGALARVFGWRMLGWTSVALDRLR